MTNGRGTRLDASVAGLLPAPWRAATTGASSSAARWRRHRRTACDRHEGGPGRRPGGLTGRRAKRRADQDWWSVQSDRRPGLA